MSNRDRDSDRAPPRDSQKDPWRAPPVVVAQIPEAGVHRDIEADAKDGAEVPDPPEPIINGLIDLGRLATDALFLAIDPYPRKPDVVFEQAVADDSPEDHPFAALKVLRPAPEPRQGPAKGKTRDGK